MTQLLTTLLAAYQRIPKPPGLPGPPGGANGAETPERFIEGLFHVAIPRWLTTFIGMVGGLSVFMLILAGILYITAYGNDERLAKAKKTAIWAVIGLLITLFSYTIVQIIAKIPFSTT